MASRVYLLFSQNKAAVRKNIDHILVSNKTTQTTTILQKCKQYSTLLYKLHHTAKKQETKTNLKTILKFFVKLKPIQWMSQQRRSSKNQNSISETNEKTEVTGSGIAQD